MHLSGSVNKLVALICVLMFCTPFVAAKSTRKKSHKHTATATAAKSKSSKPCAVSTRRRGKRSKCSKAVRPHGQQAIDNTRAREIQEALIRANYLQGNATGVWDQRTKDAMTRFQQDNGWQTKVIPDSRALIKLGLGPSHANLLNPPALNSPGLDPDTARGDMHGGAQQ